MHELSVCNALLEQVERVAAENGGGRVTRIQLCIGPLSGIEVPLLENAWPIAAAGSIAVDAELAIDAAPVSVRCTSCGAVTAAAANRLLCGACGDFRTRIESGDEMLLQRVELETGGARRDNAALDGNPRQAGNRG